MAKKDKKAAKAEVTATKAKGKKTAPTAEDQAASLERVLNPENVRPNIKAFCEWVEAQGGPKINPKHAQVVVTGYKKFQRSEDAVSAREAAKTARAEAAAERAAAREAKSKEREAEKAARAEARAEREAAAKEKAAKSTKTAAKASAPKGKAAKATPAAATGKAAAKKTAAKKTSKAKAAF